MKKNILIVEDEELLLDTFVDAMENMGYNTVGKSDGKTALEYVNSFKPDLIILDIKLPDMSGLQILEEIRKILPKVPIIMCTAYDSFKTDYEVWASKVTDYIVKPVILKDIEEKIKKILGDN